MIQEVTFCILRPRHRHRLHSICFNTFTHIKFIWFDQTRIRIRSSSSVSGSMKMSGSCLNINSLIGTAHLKIFLYFYFILLFFAQAGMPPSLRFVLQYTVIFQLYLADSWPFGITNPHFSAWKVDLKFKKNHIWCPFDFLKNDSAPFFLRLKKT
jgi:hypothetical protein